MSWTTTIMDIVTQSNTYLSVEKRMKLYGWKELYKWVMVTSHITPSDWKLVSSLTGCLVPRGSTITLLTIRGFSSCSPLWSVTPVFVSCLAVSCSFLVGNDRTVSILVCLVFHELGPTIRQQNWIRPSGSHVPPWLLVAELDVVLGRAYFVGEIIISRLL